MKTPIVSLMTSSLVLLASACGSEDESALDASQPLAVELRFDATIGGVTAACDVEYAGLGSAGASAMLADARMFVSEIQLRTTDGEWRTVELDQDTIWQTANVALLDFENDTGSCDGTGTEETNSLVTGQIAPGEYRGLRFTVGVPFELNHLDDATAPAPLNSPGMFWQWQDGYKFLKVDWMPTGANRWNVHLGSRACDNGGNPNTAPPTSCALPNRPVIELSEFTPGDTVEFALDGLIGSADITQNLVDTPPGCMSAPAEASDCSPVWSALGLSFDTGTCANGCAAQNVFRL